MKYISVDAGRYAIKTAMYVDGKLINTKIDQLYADIDIDLIKRTPILDFCNDDIITSVNGKSKQVYGKTCNKFFMPEDIQYITHDTMYFKKVVDYTLVAIANILSLKGGFISDSDIMISFSITSNSVMYTDIILNQLRGHHSVEFYDNSGELIRGAKFNIASIKFVYQGHMAYLDYAVDSKLKLIKDRACDTVMLDFGRRTLDAVYIKDMGQLKNIAIDNMGTETLLQSIANVFLKYKVIKQNNEIEDILLNKRYEFLISGNKVSLKREIESKIDIFVNNAITRVLDKFGGLTPDLYLLAGGGSLLFGSNIKNILSYGDNIQVVDNPVFANANGAIKILMRKYGEEIH